MKALVHSLAAALFVAALPTILMAQWPSYPSPNVPKLADGKPNMDGPAPKTADGKPDLSGMWEFVDAFRGQRRAAAAGATPPSAPVPGSAGNAPPGSPSPAAGGTGLGPRPLGPNQFFNIGSTLKDGLPFTPWAAALRKERTENKTRTIPTRTVCPWASCNSIRIHNRAK
jgi:hypothetical protein